MYRHLTIGIICLLAMCSMPCNGQENQSGRGTSVGTAISPTPSIHIGIGDQIDMTVFNVPEMTQRQRVDENGDYNVPLIGAVHVAGLTVQQAQALIGSKLQDGHFVRGASVSLLISDFATQGVSVMGEVTKPGVYPVWGERHLFDLVAEAGGVTPMAGKVATITHRDKLAGTQTCDFSKGDATDVANNPIIAPGDTIMVSRTGIVYVLGDVGKPGGFPLPNNQGLSLLQVIALAQGTTRTAKVSAARLIRMTAGGGRTEMALNLKAVVKGHSDDIRLQDGDIVYVPNSVAKTIADRTLPQIVAAASTAAIYTGVGY